MRVTRLARGARALPRTAARHQSATAVEDYGPPNSFKTAWTTNFEVQYYDESRNLPTYRVMDNAGQLVGDAPRMDIDTAVNFYKIMVRIEEIDKVLLMKHKMGAINWFSSSRGEEAVGATALLLEDGDYLYGQYRDLPSYMCRGMTLEETMSLNFSTQHSLKKGRDMESHYTCARRNIVTGSPPLATQMPQAVGTAYTQKLEGKGNITICYFGEGAASEGDACAAFNFAETLQAPVIFACKNNGYAIMTPSTDQYRGDGICGTAIGYGIRSTRVDGNDMFAVYEAMYHARKLCNDGLPTFIEFMTYRRGNHSTSDDSTRYRPVGQMDYWQHVNDPILRAYKYLSSVGAWDQDQEEAFRKEFKEELAEKTRTAEADKKPSTDLLFSDVYDDMPPYLQRQQAEMNAHLQKYKGEMKLSKYANW